MSLFFPRTQINVQYSGFSRQTTDTTTRTYLLVPSNKDILETDLQFMEFSSYIDYALARKGYARTASPDDADLVIFLYYGIGNPQEHQYTFFVPTYGQTGVSSSTTSGTLYSYGNWGTYRGTTTYTPQYGITGYQQRTGNYVTYFRYVSISSVDLKEFKKTNKVVELWRMEISSTGTSNDLRRVFPVMLAASMQQLGTNTQQMVSRTIFEDDQAVIDVKTGAIKYLGR